MTMNKRTVERTWIREDTLTVLLAIPLVLCITYKDTQTNVASNTMKEAMPYMYYGRALPGENAMRSYSYQAGDIKVQ